MKAQGLPITTVVIIVLAVAVLAVVIIFFLAGTGSGQASVNTFQCQQMCGTVNTLVASKQLCDKSDIDKVSTAKSFCSSNCHTKVSCVISTRGTSCGWDITSFTPNGCLTCTGTPKTPSIVAC